MVELSRDDDRECECKYDADAKLGRECHGDAVKICDQCGKAMCRVHTEGNICWDCLVEETEKEEAEKVLTKEG